MYWAPVPEKMAVEGPAANALPRGRKSPLTSNVPAPGAKLPPERTRCELQTILAPSESVTVPRASVSAPVENRPALQVSVPPVIRVRPATESEPVEMLTEPLSCPNVPPTVNALAPTPRSEEHTSETQSH